MTKRPIEHGPAALINSFEVPDVFASEATGFVQFDGVAMISFESLKVDYSRPTAPATRVTIGRLVMPIPAAQRLAIGLLDFLQKQGFDPIGQIKGRGPAN